MRRAYQQVPLKEDLIIAVQVQSEISKLRQARKELKVTRRDVSDVPDGTARIQHLFSVYLLSLIREWARNVDLGSRNYTLD